MSSFQNPRSPAGPRPGGPAAQGPGAGSVTLDPVKLLKKYAWAIPIALVVGIGLGLAVWVGLRVFAPRYAAEAVFVVRNQSDIEELGRAQNIDDDEIERFMSTQRDRMVSDEILRDVLTDPLLPTEAPRFHSQFLQKGTLNIPDALEELQDTVHASIVQGTYYIRLRATHADDETAAGLARLVQKQYLADLTGDMRIEIGTNREELTRVITGLETELRQVVSDRARLISEQSVTSLDADRSEMSQQLALLNEAIIEITQNIANASDKLENYDAMLTSDTGIQYTDTQIANVDLEPSIQNFQAELNQFKTERKALLREGLTPEHRTVRRLDNRIAATEQEMADVREQKLRKLFDAEMDSLRSGISGLRAEEQELTTRADELVGRLVDTTRIIGQIDEYDRQITSLREQINAQRSLQDELEKKNPDLIGRITLYSAPQVPDRVSFPDPKIIIPGVLFFFCALVAGVIVALELLDQRVKTVADVGMIPRTTVVGSLPDAAEDPSDVASPETVFKSVPNSVLAEHYRQLRSSILKSMDRAGHRTLMVAGCQPRSGATSVAMNLASACSAARRKTLLIDANYRRPSLHTLNGVAETNGLAEILSGIESFDRDIVHALDENLDFLPVGHKRHRIYEHLGSETMSALLAKATEEYDIVILDVSPALVSSDAATLANRVDASVLVVRALAEKRGMVARLKRDLDDARGQFLGVVVNAVRSAAGGYLRKNIQTAHDYQQNEAPATEQELKSA
ncbi:MAG: polysaccharide biosynthesis tyrosine autokinase [Phycisphaerales bacterium JB040]